MGTAVALGGDLEKVGIVVAAALAACAVGVPTARGRAWATLAALVLTPVLLLAEIWDTPQVRPFSHHPAVAAGAGLLVLGALAAAAVLLSRRPALFPIAVVATLPFRVPIESGGQTVNLLLPLYFVIAAAALSFAVPVLRADVVPGRESEGAGPRAGVVTWLLVGLAALYATQASYSADFSNALKQVAFFYVPFALLFGLLVRVEWTPALARRCLYVLAGLAVLFAGIGFVEYATRTVLLNPRVIRTNEFSSYFRVNSVFYDPNIYGRFLVLVMLAVTAAVMWSARRRQILAGAAVLVVLLGGLLLTLSQSSFAALLVGLAVLAALRWSVRGTLAVAAAALVLGAGFVVAFPRAVHLKSASPHALDQASSGRYGLVKGGVQLFADRPVAGWGAGSFTKEYRRQRGASSTRAVSASHNIPVTVAAEQGAIGLLVYLALLASAFWLLLAGAGASAVRAAVGAAFVALVFHTLLYAAFLEDPATWALLGVGVALAGAQRSALAPPGAEPE
ncbi:MAG: O-antigen ligase family protein [Actinobacteria bacterium]|nr:O-antigen ligase family protein [Actinomycetota bacterium]